MMLKELLAKKKPAIVDRWMRTILDSYPSDSLNFLKSQKNRFANPIGYTISISAEKVFDELIGTCDGAKIKSSLSDLVRMRAVQEFSPSQAIGFVFGLKGVLRDEIKEETAGMEDYQTLADLESKIDGIALIAFDLYMESREKLFRIRLDEIKARSLQEILQSGGAQV